jgi:hypothetical protein
MRRALLALLFLGCASSSQELQRAEKHEYQAQQAAIRGDYEEAQRQQEKGARHRQEALEKAQLGL